MAASNKPELVRNRKFAGRQTQLSFPSKPFPHGLQMIFKTYSYRKYVLADTFTNGQETTQGLGLANQFVQRAENTDFGAIELPFPRTLTDATNIRVTPFERDFLTERAIGAISNLAADFGGTVKNALGAVRGVGAALGSGFSQGGLDAAAKAIKENIKGVNTDQAFAMASYLGRNYLGGDISRSIGVLGGAVVNPQETLSFTGVDLRNFSFTWDLFPSNVDDSEQLKKIIRMLKNKSLPSTEGLSFGENGESVSGLNRAFLKYPDVVELNLLGVDETHFMQFKPCMISNISVSYGSGGMVTIMNGGVPNSVTLTIEFQELAIQTSEDYKINDSFIGDIVVNPDTEGLA